MAANQVIPIGAIVRPGQRTLVVLPSATARKLPAALRIHDLPRALVFRKLCKPSPILQASSFMFYRARTELLDFSTPLVTPYSNRCDTCERVGQEQVSNHRSGLIQLPVYSIA